MEKMGIFYPDFSDMQECSRRFFPLSSQKKTPLLYASAKNRRITSKTTNKSYMKIIECIRRCLSFLAVEV